LFGKNIAENGLKRPKSAKISAIEDAACGKLREYHKPLSAQLVENSVETCVFKAFVVENLVEIVEMPVDFPDCIYE